MGTTTQTGMGLAVHTQTCNYNPTGRSTCEKRIPSMESALQTGKIAAVSTNDDDDDDDDSNTFNLNAFVVVSICNIHTLVLHLFEELYQDQRQRHLYSAIQRYITKIDFRFHGSSTITHASFSQGNGCMTSMWL